MKCKYCVDDAEYLEFFYEEKKWEYTCEADHGNDDEIGDTTYIIPIDGLATDYSDWIDHLRTKMWFTENGSPVEGDFINKALFVRRSTNDIPC